MALPRGYRPRPYRAQTLNAAEFWMPVYEFGEGIAPDCLLAVGLGQSVEAGEQDARLEAQVRIEDAHLLYPALKGVLLFEIG